MNQLLAEPDSRTQGEAAPLLEQLRGLVQTQVVETRDWYKSKAARPRRLFQTAGALVILLSVSIPLLAVLDYPGKDLVLSVIALLIAALTGLNSFFKWESSWRARRQTEFALTHLLSGWDLRIIEAMQEADPEQARQLILQATRQLLEEARVVVGAETEEFFSKMTWPQTERR